MNEWKGMGLGDGRRGDGDGSDELRRIRDGGLNASMEQ